ncbi:MAG: hypothetical protein ACR2G3_11675 [Solirubrobacterales bacterium]
MVSAALRLLSVLAYGLAGLAMFLWFCVFVYLVLCVIVAPPEA